MSAKSTRRGPGAGSSGDVVTMRRQDLQKLLDGFLEAVAYAVVAGVQAGVDDAARAPGATAASVRDRVLAAPLGEELMAEIRATARAAAADPHRAVRDLRGGGAQRP